MTTLTHDEELAALLEDIKVGDIVHRGSDKDTENETPPMVVDQVVPVNRRRLWDAETGEMYLAPSWIVGRRSEQTVEGTLRGYGLLGILMDNGKPKWVDRDPGIAPPVRNNYKCRLHPEDPDRARWTGMGFPVCHKSGIPSEYDLDNHMRIKHKTVYLALEREREERRRDRDAEQQRLMVAALTKLAGEPVANTITGVSTGVTEASNLAIVPTEYLPVMDASSDEEVVASTPVRKFLSQMNKDELMAYCNLKGYAYNPASSKGEILKHVRNMESYK
jgi:hypothetical protein